MTSYDNHELSHETQTILRRNIPKHYDAFQYRRLLEELGLDWAPIRKTVSIRNPWPRLVSLYKWQKAPGIQNDQPVDTRAFENFLRTYPLLGRLPLEQFVSVYDGNYESANFTVLKVEEFDSQLPATWKALQLPGHPPQSVPVVNKRIEREPGDIEPSSQPSYVAWYTDLARDLVQASFAEDIRVGSYQFGN